MFNLKLKCILSLLSFYDHVEVYTLGLSDDVNDAAVTFDVLFQGNAKDVPSNIQQLEVISIVPLEFGFLFKVY